MTGEVFANNVKIADVSYCCSFCRCARPQPGEETILRIPVPSNNGNPPLRPWQGWTNVYPREYRLTARSTGENGTMVEATPVNITVFDRTIHISGILDGTVLLAIPFGSITMGSYDLEASDDLRTWKRLGPFQPGNVAAFYYDVPRGPFLRTPPVAFVTKMNGYERVRTPTSANPNSPIQNHSLLITRPSTLPLPRRGERAGVRGKVPSIVHAVANPDSAMQLKSKIQNPPLALQNCLSARALLPFYTRAMQSHELLREVLQNCSAKQLSSELGLSLSLIYKWAEPPEAPAGSGAANPLDRIDALYRCSQDVRIVEWICQRAGGFFIRNPRHAHSHPDYLIPATNEIVQEFADLLAVIATAAADNSINTREAKSIRARWEELKSVTEGFVVCCEEGNFAALKDQPPRSPKSAD